MRGLSKIKCYNYHHYGEFASRCPEQKKRKGKQHASIVDVDDQPQKKTKESKYDEIADGIRKEYFFIFALSGTITNNVRFG